MDKAKAAEPDVISIDAPTSARRIRSLNPQRAIDALRVSSTRLFDVKLANEVSTWQSIKRIDLWCKTTKAALRRLLATPGLEEANLRELRQHGSLAGMPRPTTLHTLRCSWLSSDDLLNIADLPDLRILGAQYAQLSPRAVSGLARMESLSDLDLEGSNLTDDMASILSAPTSIESLSVGATRIGSKGLERICQMTQLRELDIWALDIQECDLDMLSGLARLNYLSVGGREEQSVLTASGVLPRIARLPSLRRLWLDGIALTADEISELERRYERVKVT
jgi:hypothetical protein